MKMKVSPIKDSLLFMTVLPLGNISGFPKQTALCQTSWEGGWAGSPSFCQDAQVCGGPTVRGWLRSSTPSVPEPEVLAACWN